MKSSENEPKNIVGAANWGLLRPGRSCGAEVARTVDARPAPLSSPTDAQAWLQGIVQRWLVGAVPFFSLICELRQSSDWGSMQASEDGGGAKFLVAKGTKNFLGNYL